MLSDIWSFLCSLPDMLMNLVTWLFMSVFNALADILYFIIDIILSVVSSLVSSVDFAEMSILQSFNDWGLLPDQVLWLLDYINFQQNLVLLAAAYTIRLLLNLIPGIFTRV